VLFDGSIWPPSPMRPMRDLENLRCTVEKDNGSFKMFQNVSRIDPFSTHALNENGLEQDFQVG
jgi:hypothetical protein